MINLILQRQVMAVGFIRDILTPAHQPHTSHPSKHSRRPRLPWHRKRAAATLKEDEPSMERESAAIASGGFSSTTQFEDPLSVNVFTQGTTQLRKQESVPWDIYHHWNGDAHSHAHLEAREVNVDTGNRERAYSEGEPASPHSISVLQQHRQVVRECDEPEDKGQNGT